jgi:hypothetical protein
MSGNISSEPVLWDASQGTPASRVTQSLGGPPSLSLLDVDPLARRSTTQ